MFVISGWYYDIFGWKSCKQTSYVLVQNRFFSQLKIITNFHPKLTSQNIVLKGNEQVFNEFIATDTAVFGFMKNKSLDFIYYLYTSKKVQLMPVFHKRYIIEGKTLQLKHLCQCAKLLFFKHPSMHGWVTTWLGVGLWCSDTR